MSFAISFLLIDLDDTLAPEWDYVAGGYRAAAEVLARLSKENVDILFNRFVYEHMKYGRYRIMDRMTAAFGMDPAVARSLVSAYRAHAPAMQFYPGARQALQQLARSECKLAVVTDGAVEMQQRKVQAIGLEDLVDTVVYCMAYDAPKPDPGGFRIAMQQIGADPERTLVVGDDPFHDLGAAAAIGVSACRVRTGRYGLVESPKVPALVDIAAFSALPAWLNGRLS